MMYNDKTDRFLYYYAWYLMAYGFGLWATFGNILVSFALGLVVGIFALSKWDKKYATMNK